MQDFKTNLQKTLRNIRMACGFTQDEVAEVLNVDRSTYTYYERGKTSPDTQTLRILAELYGISPEIFMFPEKYADMKPDMKKLKTRKKPLSDPQHFGELTREEKNIIKEFRLKREDSPMVRNI